MPSTVHLIRHGQSTFNMVYAETGEDPIHIDARLTPLGHEQVKLLRPIVRRNEYDLIVTSPLTRAIQTTLGLFGGLQVPFLVEAGHREWLEASCDMGRPKSMLAAEFPGLDFTHLPEIWWHDQGERDPNGICREPYETFLGRVEAFRDWLRRRPEDRICVVGHATFFKHLAGNLMKNCEMLPWKP